MASSFQLWHKWIVWPLFHRAGQKRFESVLTGLCRRRCLQAHNSCQPVVPDCVCECCVKADNHGTDFSDSSSPTAKAEEPKSALLQTLATFATALGRSRPARDNGMLMKLFRREVRIDNYHG
ncbi:unnamed protein product [Protopolystoma xenopodis]|uniref:Uncharacterized protein n=1 Tax=Protopolystoma xenopodis TaxID=117903 RepID=A0A3S5ACB4_9PLAT|nr:unnamed protein product [Protopolystoma xenopodis]